MSWEIDRKKCLRCGACVSVCPEVALDLKENGLQNDKDKCTSCSICSKICPVHTIKVEK